jgi:DNA-binding beta-propeller fold protein YncE
MAEMKSFRHLLFAVSLALVVAACTSQDEVSPTTTAPAAATAQDTPGANPEPSVTTTAPPASFAGESAAPEFPGGLDWLNTAAPLRLQDLRGKVVLLDFWTYGCINCIHVIPDLKRLEAEFADELVVIGVHSAKFVNESSTENIRNVLLRYDVEHPVVNDRDFEVWRTWGAQAWPTTVLIDPAGNVVGGHSGEGVYDVVAPVIASLVDEFSATGQIDATPLELRLEKEGLAAGILSFPGKVFVTPGDPRLFIADSGRNRIVVADRVSGDVLAVYGNGRRGFGDGAAREASFDAPQGMALAEDGVTLFVADTNNHAIRAIDTTTGDVTTLLGTGSLGWPPVGGVAPSVPINSPWDVLRDGNQLYIAMAGHHQIWVMDLATGIAAPLVGSAREGVRNGPLDEAELAQPSGLALDNAGRLYFADSESSSIRYADVKEANGATGLVAGGAANLFEFGDADGVGPDARFQHPLGVVLWNGALVVADTYNSVLRSIDPTSQEVTTLLGSEQGWADGMDPQFYEPGGLAIDADTLYVADTNNHAIRVVDLPSGETSTLVLKGIDAFEPRPEDADYRGTIVRLDAVTLGQGQGEILLDVALPEGYKVNDEAPSSLTLTIVGDAISIGAAAQTIDLTGRSLPAAVPIELSSGTASLEADLVLLYCREDAASLCLIEQVRFSIEVIVDASGTENRIRLPRSFDAPRVSGDS